MFWLKLLKYYRPSQKSPLPLNRYDEFVNNFSTPQSTLCRSSSYKTMAKALFSFQVPFLSKYNIKIFANIKLSRPRIIKNWLLIKVTLSTSTDRWSLKYLQENKCLPIIKVFTENRLTRTGMKEKEMPWLVCFLLLMWKSCLVQEILTHRY